MPTLTAQEFRILRPNEIAVLMYFFVEHVIHLTSTRLMLQTSEDGGS